MKIILFRIQTRRDVDEAEYTAAFEEMYELVTQMPGFISLDSFSNEMGEELAVARFDSDEHLREWRDLPAHKATQLRGREEFFDSYRITVADLDREYGWSRDQD